MFGTLARSHLMKKAFWNIHRGEENSTSSAYRLVVHMMRRKAKGARLQTGCVAVAETNENNNSKRKRIYGRAAQESISPVYVATAVDWLDNASVDLSPLRSLSFLARHLRAVLIAVATGGRGNISRWSRVWRGAGTAGGVLTTQACAQGSEGGTRELAGAVLGHSSVQALVTCSQSVRGIYK